MPSVPSRSERLIPAHSSGLRNLPGPAGSSTDAEAQRFTRPTAKGCVLRPRT